MNEMSRIRFCNESNMWVVEILSAAINDWMVVSERSSKEDAEAELKDWR